MSACELQKPGSDAASLLAGDASAEDGRIYLLGHPIGHSLSPALHERVYRALGLPWTYELADKETPDQARNFIEKRAYLAMNVTRPYKPLALACASDADQTAVQAGGANVLVACEEGLRAFNFDGIGAVEFLIRRGVGFNGAKVVVCGMGPTGRAVAAAAQARGAQALLLGRDTGSSQAREALRAATLIVNATPLGMGPEDPAPFDTALLRPGQSVLDATYGAPAPSALVASARAAGCRAWDGRGMLVSQAALTVGALCDIIRPACGKPSYEELVGMMEEVCPCTM